MIKWRFGNLLANSFADQEQNGYTELTPDAGVPFRREVFADIQNIIAGSVNLSLNEYLDFKSFYRNDTRQGTIPFEFYDCRVDMNRNARFLGTPSYSNSSGRYVVSFRLSLESVDYELPFFIIGQDGSFIIAQNGDNIIGTEQIEV